MLLQTHGSICPVLSDPVVSFSGVRCLLAVALMFCGGAQAWGIDLSGSYKNLLFQTRDSLDTALTTDLNRLRLVAEDSGGHFSWHVAYDHELLYGDLIASPDFRAIANIPEPTYVDAQARVSDGGRHDWQHSLYRGWIRFKYRRLQLTIGRQRIAWGSGRLWNPTDRFNPIDPTALEPEEKLGVDSLYAEYGFSEFGAVQLVAAPGRFSRRVSRKLALRLRDTIGETDYALMLGLIGRERIFGADVTTNLWDGGLRLEVMHARPRGGTSYTQAIFGYDYTLTSDIFPAGLYLLAEYFFNGAPELSLQPSNIDRLNSRVRHQLGLSAGYDLTPLWRLDGLYIQDLSKGSRFFSPKLTWSAMENVDISLFAFLFSGNTTSEFGLRKNLYALQAEVYF